MRPKIKDYAVTDSTLLGALGMFLFGMNMMSSVSKKQQETNFADYSLITSNRLKGVLTGLTITAVYSLPVLLL